MDQIRTPPTRNQIYAAPRLVTRLDECHFYHTMEIPGYGVVKGEWDLRGGVRSYLGGVDFSGKRVLEVGTASGFLCFQMESQGAEVVSYDLSDEYLLDLAPSRCNVDAFVPAYRSFMRRLNNAYWLSHAAYKSNARVVYGTVYAMPAEIGMVDISTLCAILCHLRDPLSALRSALRFTKEKVIVTEPLWTKRFILQAMSGLTGPSMVFLPEFWSREPQTNWWLLTPSIVRRFIGTLGFEESRVSYHFQRYKGRRRLLYTVVGQRTRPVEHTSSLPSPAAMARPRLDLNGSSTAG